MKRERSSAYTEYTLFFICLRNIIYNRISCAPHFSNHMQKEAFAYKCTRLDNIDKDFLRNRLLVYSNETQLGSHIHRPIQQDKIIDWNKITYRNTYSNTFLTFPC